MRFFFTAALIFHGLSNLHAQDIDSVYFATGFKIGDVTNSSATILTRLCKTPKPVAVYHERKESVFRHPIDFDNDMPIHEMEGAVPGSSGQVRIEFISEDTLISIDWEYVSTYKDFTIKRKIDGLLSNTHYSIILQGRKDVKSPITEIRGSFKTAPSANEEAPVFFTTSTCQYYWSFDDSLRGFKIYDSMLKLNPAFHCQTGDYVYYDKPGPLVNNVELARHKWHAMNSWPSLLDFYGKTPLYLQKDDHDLLKDDAGPSSTPLGSLSYEDGLAVWREQAPIKGTPYRTFRWGKDLQIWSVEGREFRSKNKTPDAPDKTIWGKEQIRWFKETIEASDATFKILVSPTPIVGPDRSKGKFDNHSNASFQTEGMWLRKYLADHNVFVINGDRHWQYVSVDPETGLWEFSQGPVSDFHAQGWNQDDKRPEHKFLRVKGGFLGVKVYRQKADAVIEFIHYDTDGSVVNKEIIKKPLGKDFD
ncbi:MAG: alkaline phosphatase D [Arcticibacterium sp.]|jgi:alkaline phosphatase D